MIYSPSARDIAIAAVIALAVLVVFTLGLTQGYSGCVADASALTTNKILRGM